MKSQSVQLFILFMAICALMVHATPASKDKNGSGITDEQRRRMGDRNNYGANEYGAHGYGSQGQRSTSPAKGSSGHHIKGDGHDSGSAYGTGYAGGSGSVGGSSGGSHTDSSSGSKKSGGGFFGRNKN